MKELSIGEMAELNCITKKTLRFYQEKGLLEPVRTDEATGYRYYSINQCATVDMIHHMQQMGFSLEEIQDVVAHDDIEYYENVVADKMERVEDQLRELIIAKRLGESMLQSCRISKIRLICDEVMIERLPDRKIIRFGIPNPDFRKPNLTAEEALEEWELTLRGVKQIMWEQNLPHSLFRNVACVISKDSLEKRNLVFDDTCVFVRKSFGKIFYEAEEVPGGQYLTLYCGSFRAENGDYAEMINLNKMLDYAEEKGYEITGDYIGEIIAETPVFHYEGRDALFKMQFPIAKKAQSST